MSALPKKTWPFRGNPRTHAHELQARLAIDSQPASQPVCLSVAPNENAANLESPSSSSLPSSLLPFLGGPDVVGEDRAGQTRQQQCSLRTLRNGRRRQKRPLRSDVDDGYGPAPSLIERTAGPPDRRAVLRSVLLLLLSLDIAISIRASTRTKASGPEMDIRIFPAIMEQTSSLNEDASHTLCRISLLP